MARNRGHRDGRKRPHADAAHGRDDTRQPDEDGDGPAKKKTKRDQYRESAVAHDAELPRKRFYRQRAHANPFSDHNLDYPLSPAHMDWSAHYPAFVDRSAAPVSVEDDDDDDDGVHVPRLSRAVDVLDVGCGFGGLLFALAPAMPHRLILGMEIRVSVAEYVAHKIRAVRARQDLLAAGQPLPTTTTTATATTTKREAEAGKGDADDEDDDDEDDDAAAPGGTLVAGRFANVGVLRANAMKFLPHFFARASLAKLFLCFPDPHFKARKQKQRIVSATLVAEYAYVLRPGGVVHAITDVEDLAAWIARFFDASPSFARVAEEELCARGAEDAAVVAAMRNETEEGKKVARNGGSKFTGFWTRLEDPPWPPA